MVGKGLRSFRKDTLHGPIETSPLHQQLLRYTVALVSTKEEFSGFPFPLALTWKLHGNLLLLKAVEGDSLEDIS